MHTGGTTNPFIGYVVPPVCIVHPFAQRKAITLYLRPILFSLNQRIEMRMLLRHFFSNPRNFMATKCTKETTAERASLCIKIHVHVISINKLRAMYMQVFPII